MEEIIQSETPIKDAWKDRVDHVDTIIYDDVKLLEVGDFICIKKERSAPLVGFVTKINRKLIHYDTTYGGWGGNDIIIMKMIAHKTEIYQFCKPLK